MSKTELGPDDRLNRRQVLRGSAALFGAVPLCCTTPPLSSASVRYGGGLLTIDLHRASELRRVGSAAAYVDAARGIDVIVARTGRREFVALDRSCTHNGAQCAYNHRRRTLQCTSLNHAEYDLRGTLLHGRTHGNLRAYPVRRSGRMLEIRLAG